MERDEERDREVEGNCDPKRQTEKVIQMEGEKRREVGVQRGGRRQGGMVIRREKRDGERETERNSDREKGE